MYCIFFFFQNEEYFNLSSIEYKIKLDFAPKKSLLNSEFIKSSKIDKITIQSLDNTKA